jgi:hypothetical protein
MSRTFRKQHYHPGALRNPKTQNEIKQIEFILSDIQDEDYTLSGMNHLHHRLASIPTANSDLVVSAYYESDYDCD